MHDPGGAVATTGSRTGGDNILFRDMDHSIAAIGRGASVIVNQALSRAGEAREQKRFEDEQLALAIACLAESLKKHVQSPPPATTNPYKGLLYYDILDAARFFGREEITAQLMEDLMQPGAQGRLLVLHGEAGSGKTSLLRAGVLPALIVDEQLPLYLQVTDQPLVMAIKQSLLPDLTRTPTLMTASLQGFTHQVAKIPGTSKGVTIILDQFERFFEAPKVDRQEFLNELARCLYDEATCARWLISIRSSHLGYMNTCRPLLRHPLANTEVLGPLSREDAQMTIEEPAATTGLEIEDALCERLLDDLGGQAVEPAKLQIVCHTLVEALPAGDNQLTMDHYLATGPTDRILARYLDFALQNTLPPGDDELAWPVLAAIVDLADEATAENIAARLKAGDISAEACNRLLSQLLENRLLRLSGETYLLVSASFVPRILQWCAERAALEQARLETVRQMERVRNSALRGLIFGGIGFALAFLIAYASQISTRSLLAYITILRAIPGGIAGLLLILLIDIGQTTYRYRRQNMIWVAGGLAGAASFAFAFWMHVQARISDPLLLAVLQGALWGVLCGLGSVWVLKAKNLLWPKVLAVTLGCGLAFWLLNGLGMAFGEPVPYALLILSGTILALCLLVAALLSHLGDGSYQDISKNIKN